MLSRAALCCCALALAVVLDMKGQLDKSGWQLAAGTFACILPCWQLKSQAPFHAFRARQVSQEEMLLRVAREQAALAAGSATSPGGAGGSGGSPGSEGSGSGAQQAQPGQTASPVTCYYLSKELRRVVDEEWVLRGKLWSEGALFNLPGWSAIHQPVEAVASGWLEGSGCVPTCLPVKAAYLSAY